MPLCGSVGSEDIVLLELLNSLSRSRKLSLETTELHKLVTQSSFGVERYQYRLSEPLKLFVRCFLLFVGMSSVSAGIPDKTLSAR